MPNSTRAHKYGSTEITLYGYPKVWISHQSIQKSNSYQGFNLHHHLSYTWFTNNVQQSMSAPDNLQMRPYPRRKLITNSRDQFDWLRYSANESIINWHYFEKQEKSVINYYWKLKNASSNTYARWFTLMQTIIIETQAVCRLYRFKTSPHVARNPVTFICLAGDLGAGDELLKRIPNLGHSSTTFAKRFITLLSYFC